MIASLFISWRPAWVAIQIRECCAALQTKNANFSIDFNHNETPYYTPQYTHNTSQHGHSSNQNWNVMCGTAKHNTVQWQYIQVCAHSSNQIQFLNSRHDDRPSDSNKRLAESSFLLLSVEFQIITSTNLQRHFTFCIVEWNWMNFCLQRISCNRKSSQKNNFQPSFLCSFKHQNFLCQPKVTRFQCVWSNNACVSVMHSHVCG